MHIFHAFACSKIKTKNKGTIYLSETAYVVNKRIEYCKDGTITLHKSNLTRDKLITMNISDIVCCKPV